MHPFSTLSDLLFSAAERWPERPIRIVGGRDLTLPELILEAQKMAATARSRIQPGDRVLLLLEDIEDFLVAFWAVQFLGATAVPLAPPRPLPSELQRVQRVIARCKGPVITDRGVQAPIPTLDVGHLRRDASPMNPIRSVAPALVQFSSGSTGDPRGVVLGHAQLLANIRQLAVLPWESEDVAFVWMPHFHDMGLIGGHLLPLQVGMQQVRMRAAAAMHNPLDWLQAAHDFQATLLSSTNSGLARVVARLEAGAKVPDLSGIRMVINGAEPISPKVCRAFSHWTGIPESAHFPMYGLAEASVGVAAPRHLGLQTATLGGREVALHGPLLPEIEARFVEGELRLKGPNLCLGYLEDPEATATLFDEEGFLRTGDLACLVDGQLAVIGRMKDIIAINGQKLHAHDVEALVETLPGVRVGVAVADTRTEVEGLAILVQTQPETMTAGVLWAVRQAILKNLGFAPTEVLAIPSVPRTTSGKKRRALLREALMTGRLEDASNTLEAVLRAFQEAAGHGVDANRPLTEAGISSIIAVDALGRLGERLGVVLDHRLLLRASTLRGLATLIEQEAPENTPIPQNGGREPIAIIAMACRLPGADDPLSFWEDLRQGVSRIGPGPADRPISGLTGGWLDTIDRFDADRWHIPAEEAAAMDPQQRLLLMLADEALKPLEHRTQTGVFIGAGQLAYAEVVRAHIETPLPPGTLAGNLLSMLAARLSHHLDLRGPALTVDTACSAGLVAVHLAAQALQEGSCERAIAGAVNLNLSPGLHQLLGVAGALSPSGQCRPFMAEADGTVLGEGAVLFVLEPLSLARARGEPILAILRGSAINNDGTSLSVMAPNPAGQEAVLRAALAMARVDPAAVAFVETHGTGTPVGDGVERRVLSRVYPQEPRMGACKGHVGHLMGAAGAVGLLRCIGELDPGILGAVSSFGFGGTNAHLLLEGGSHRPQRPALKALSPRFWLGRVSAEGLLYAVMPDPAGGLSFRAVSPGPGVQRGSRILVTGATGALGRALCRWLREAGASVVGVARKPASGLNIQLIQGDVADPQTAQRLQALGPFDLGFHLAGSLDHPLQAKRDGLAMLRSVKVGVWVLASSISAVIPGLDRGIEAYAAANRALIEVAVQGRSQNRLDVALSLAPIAGEGMARDMVAALQSRGIPSLSLDQAVACLIGAVGGPAHIVAMHRPQALGNLPMPEDLTGQVTRLVAQAAGLETVDPDISLGALGIDSLGALEVLKALEKLLDQRLPTTLLYENDTVTKIIAALAGSSHLEMLAPALSNRLLPSQQTFVVQDSYFPDMPGNVLISVDVSPPLERGLLEQALALVLDRHPALSAVIRELRQVDGVARPTLCWMETLDRAAIADRCFELSTGPLERVYCNGRTLVLNGHHAVVDAWSQKVVLEDLLTLYEDLRQGHPPSLPPLRSAWQQVAQPLREVSPEAVAAYKAKFAGGVPPLHLDWDAPVDAPSSGGCGTVRRVLDLAASAALEARAKAAGVSLPALVLAAWAQRLYAGSGQSDLVIRVAHGRREARLPDIERVVGAFADGLPLHVQIVQHQTLEMLAQLVQAELSFAATHAGAGSAALAAVGEQGPSGPVGLSPAGFTFPLLPTPESVGGLELSEVHGAAGAGFTRLTLIAWIFRGQLHLSLSHARSHFSAQKASAYADALLLSLSQPPLPLPDTLHGRILRNCRAFPERPAVGLLSYGALEQRSGALALRLPPGRIAVLAAQSPEAAIALLAVLRSGAAFVPLDPEWPDPRIAQILAAARPSALITTAALAVRAQIWSLPLYIVDEACSTEGPDRPGELAYVMFTSGSTGRPKGVVVHHAEHLIFQEWVSCAFGITAADRFVGTSSLGYGGSLRQLFTPLLHGGQSCPVPRDIARDPDALAEFIDREGITIWNSVPAMWGHLMDAAVRRGSRFPSLRWVLIGGEAVPASQARRWRAHFCGRLANLYGSTETIVNATMYEVVRDLPASLATVPIGWPRGGTPVYLLDIQEGVGEIAVGGAIAQGYWEDTAATDAAFVVDPQRGRLYRTGDFARRRPDGALEFVGRADAQVQIHGNRVELAEIEQVILQAPGVAACAVIYAEGQLVAFVAYTVEGDARPENLRLFVAARLPAPMLPQRFQQVAAIPRNPAGKVDRLQLRAEVLAGSALALTEAAPPRPASRALAQLTAAWREVLQLKQDPLPEDDFFMLGGDSIRALEVLERLRAQGVHALRPLELYATRQLSALADLIEQKNTSSNGAFPDSGINANLTETSLGEPFPLSSVQRGFLTASTHVDRAPVWVARVPLLGPLDRAALERALLALVARHAMLRTIFIAQNPAFSPRQQVLPTANLPLQFDDLSLLSPAAQERALETRFEEELSVRFDLSRAPLFRVRLCHLSEQSHMVLVSSHHIVSDAWSLWVLARDLMAAHDGQTLPPLQSSFREAVASEASQDDRWWRQQLAGLSQDMGPSYQIPTVRRLQLCPVDWEMLRAYARSQAVSPYAVVLYCMFSALQALNGSDDCVVATALAARDSVQGAFAEVVGPFARALPVRVQGTLTLSKVSKAFEAAFAHSEASSASMAAGLEGGAVLERLGRYFLTWLDPSAVPMKTASLSLDWSRARFQFATPSTATELMVSVLVQEGLQIGLHGGPMVADFAPALERCLGQLVRPDAALIIYPPPGFILPFDQPVMVEQVRCGLGRSELILAPLSSLEGDLSGMLRAATAATRARVVALAGLLPARTGLGRETLTGADQILTTGHAATVCAMARTISAVLEATGRHWASERVGMLGYGAIGRAVLALMVHQQGPAQRVCIDDPSWPERESVLGCSLILAATSVGGVLSVDALASGTIVVDDSFPRAFDDAEALARMQDPGDVLFLGGGMLDAGPLDRQSPFPQAAALRAQYPAQWLPGCHAEALLVAWAPELGPTVGPVDLARALAMDGVIARAGWNVAPLHLGPWVVPEVLLERFRGQPGT